MDLEGGVIAIADMNTIYKHIIPQLLEHLGVDKSTVIDVTIRTENIVVRRNVLDDGGARAKSPDGEGYLIEIMTFPRAEE